MDKMEVLQIEMHRITTCPYTPSLKKLHDILQSIDIDLLQQWARGNACQIGYLAAVVLEGLELWPFAVDLLTTLASVPSFGKAALQQKRGLLETFLTKAIDSNSGFDKYAATCIAFLSTPLDFPIPSKASKFFMKCLERAVQSLSSETIRPVYLLSSAVESSYLDMLPPDILTSLQTQIIRLLSKLDSDDHLASLLCLAVLAKFSSRPRDTENFRPKIHFTPQDELGLDSADRFLPARRFFLSRVPKTLDLIVIKAITACSQSCKLGIHGIIESLRLSREVLDTFDARETNHWLDGSTRKINKLHEKVLRPGIDAKVQCEAMSLLVALSAGGALLPEVVINLKGYLLTSEAHVLSTNAIGQCLVFLEDAPMRELLDLLLALACDERQPCRESLTRIENALRLISVFTERISTSSKLIKAVLSHISSSMVSGMLRQYASQVQGTSDLEFICDHSTGDLCPSSYREARERLRQSLAVMILKSALHAPQSGCHFDASAMILLLENQFLRCPARYAFSECTKRRPMNIVAPRLSMFEAISTPRMDSASVNWRDGLMREMLRDTDCRYESIMRMVGEICRDLELRCSNIEGPLREEQSKSRDLQARLESCKQDKAELERQTQNYRSAIGTLETERDRIALVSETTKRQLKELGTSLDNTRLEFDRVQIEAERTAQAAIENARQQDLVYLATLTGKDEVLEDQSLKLANTENHAQALEHELNRVKGLEADGAERLLNSETHMETLKNAIFASECCVKNLENELIRTKEQNAHSTARTSNNMALIEELNSTIVAQNEVSEQNGLLILNLKDRLQKAEFETSELRLQHETYVSATNAEIRRLDESHRSLNDKMQCELEAAHSSAAAATDQFTATIFGLNSKVRKLRKERKERAREFAEAQELSGRLVSLMGTAKGQISSHEADMMTPGNDGNSDLPLSAAESPDLPPAKPFQPSKSRTSSRAPKRVKRLLDPKTPKTCAAKGLLSPKISNDHRLSTVRVGRVPLADLTSTQGSRPLTPKTSRHGEHPSAKIDGAGKVPAQNHRQNQKLGFEEDSFSGEDIFTSTDRQQLSALRSKSPRQNYDETTTDF